MLFWKIFWKFPTNFQKNFGNSIHVIPGNPPKCVSTNRCLLRFKTLLTYFSVDMLADWLFKSISKQDKKQICPEKRSERFYECFWAFWYEIPNFETVFHVQTNEWKVSAKFAEISMVRNHLQIYYWIKLSAIKYVLLDLSITTSNCLSMDWIVSLIPFTSSVLQKWWYHMTCYIHFIYIQQ